MLSDLHLRQSYRSDQCNIVNDFYIPCLSESNLYRRAVGYYSSSSLTVAAKGLNAFIKNGGKMQLVASPFLTPDDIDAISKGYRNRSELENSSIINALDGEYDKVVSNRLAFLAWLIERDRLDVKIATLKDKRKYGIYHEKLGIFSDGKSFVAFTGSPNESESGFINNFECIDVYRSWISEDKKRAMDKLNNFELLWENRTINLEVSPFPEAARSSLLKFRKDQVFDNDPEQRGVRKGAPTKVDSIKLRGYQIEAIENWFKANGRGTLKMATGSGKTITALSLATKLNEKIDLSAMIIICPYRHLVSQWKKECEKFGLEPILCFENASKWSGVLRSRLYKANDENSSFICVITTNATFIGDIFQSSLPYFPEKTLVIGDEAHNLGATNISNKLPRNVGLRLALSATPERWYDESGTQSIFEYFGPVLKPEFTIKDAIREEALVPYYYYPIFVSLNDEEFEEYREITLKIARQLAISSSESKQSSILTSLYNKRSRIIGAAYNKLTALKDLMKNRLESSHTLIYCGDGSVEGTTSIESVKQINAVCELLGYELGYRVDSYTAETSLDEREELRTRFVEGDLQGLVAIRCLDEGVDIPEVKTAIILASSTNPKQFIQRRGRVLRRSSNKKSAEIFDMIVVPSLDQDEEMYNIERSLFLPELRRYLQFAELALNSGEALGKIAELQRQYNLFGIK